jgi:hypothetical protein
VATALVHADRRRNSRTEKERVGQKDMSKLIGACRDYAERRNRIKFSNNRNIQLYLSTPQRCMGGVEV